MGFRGEALYAIAAVAEITLASCPGSGREGWRLELSGGELKSEGAAPPVPGTSIEVRNLFFNTPARLKVPQDRRHRASPPCPRGGGSGPGPARPERVTLRMEGKLSLRLGPAEGPGTMGTRASEALGREHRRGPHPGLGRAPGGHGQGLISSPDALLGNRNAQYFFVNGRPVSSRLLQQALYKAYEGRIERKHPPACSSSKCRAPRST